MGLRKRWREAFRLDGPHPDDLPEWHRLDQVVPRRAEPSTPLPSKQEIREAKRDAMLAPVERGSRGTTLEAAKARLEREAKRTLDREIKAQFDRDVRCLCDQCRGGYTKEVHVQTWPSQESYKVPGQRA